VFVGGQAQSNPPQGYRDGGLRCDCPPYSAGFPAVCRVVVVSSRGDSGAEGAQEPLGPEGPEVPGDPAAQVVGTLARPAADAASRLDRRGRRRPHPGRPQGRHPTVSSLRRVQAPTGRSPRPASLRSFSWPAPRSGGPLPGDPSSLPICFSVRTGRRDAEAADEDPPLAGVEPPEQPARTPPPPPLDVRPLELVGAGVERVLVVARRDWGWRRFFPRKPRELVADRPGGIGAELVAERVVEPLDGADQDVVAVADPLEQVVARPSCRLDRNLNQLSHRGSLPRHRHNSESILQI